MEIGLTQDLFGNRDSDSYRATCVDWGKQKWRTELRGTVDSRKVAEYYETIQEMDRLPLLMWTWPNALRSANQKYLVYKIDYYDDIGNIVSKGELLWNDNAGNITSRCFCSGVPKSTPFKLVRLTQKKSGLGICYSLADKTFEIIVPYEQLHAERLEKYLFAF